MRENRFQAILIRRLRKAGSLVLNIIPNELGGKGWPDIYVAHRAWSGFIELKSGDRRQVTKAQKQRIHQLINRGVNACVLRMKDGKIMFQEFDESTLDLITNLEIMPLSSLMNNSGPARLLSFLQNSAG